MADRGDLLSAEDFTIGDALFWGGALFFLAGCVGGLVADGFPRWNFQVGLDWYSLAFLTVAVAGVRFLRWPRSRGASILLYGGGSTFALTLVHDLVVGTASCDVSAYNNLFILSLFMAPAVFLAGRWSAPIFGTVILGLLIVAGVFGPAPTLSAYLWFEVPAVLGVVFLLYRYRMSLDRVLIDLQRAVRENKVLRERERLAALGELAAGISHEIKNPLNFVINFAESSTLLLDDLAGADPEERAYLLEELRLNLEEIRTQGHRGVDIVRTMLGHARSVSAPVQDVDLNALAAESLQLAWLGLRDRSRAAAIRHRLIPSDEPLVISGYRGDLGRALVNLCSNAFWSVSARSQRASGSYVPEVTVQVSRREQEAWVTVRDNGLGFDPRLRDQLFVPFYTTKPPGEGTGLGLSLCREVVVDQHRGRLEAEGDTRGGAEFRMILPLGGGLP